MLGKKIALCTVAVFLLSLTAAWAQPASAVSNSIVINIPSRTIELYAGNERIKTYPVAVGKPSTPTPLGTYSIIDKEINPWWFPPGEKYSVPSGPSNPLGYRWMGFGGNYGVHGTNAPWSIGSAVSNGCVRMQEEDVEELFESVDVGTPITITYDRVKVQIDANGEASIGIYPDIYGYCDVSLQEVKDLVNAYHLNGLVTDDFLIDLIRQEPDRQVVLGRIFDIKLNNTLISNRGILSQDTLYIPAFSLAEKLKLNASWDPASGLFSYDQSSVPSIMKGGNVYIDAVNLPTLFGGTYQWLPDINLLELKIPMVYLNTSPVTGDIQKINNILAINILPLTEALGINGIWNSITGTFTVRGKQIPVITVDQKPYIQITKIYEYFRAYVYWNETNQTINLTYPFAAGND